VQITSKSVNFQLGTIEATGEVFGNVPINSTLKLSVNMSNFEKKLIEQIIGAEALKNRADIFIDDILEELTTKNRGE